jgi:DNA-binding transcriptional LysR family regulator
MENIKQRSERPTQASATNGCHSIHYFRRNRISLEQWRVLHAVIACGSFSNAADFLHITQPAVSYSISKIEEQLGIPLIRFEGRKALITDAGRALVERSGLLLREASDLEAFAESLRLDRKAEFVAIAVEVDSGRSPRA